MSGHIKRNCTRFLQKKLIVPQISRFAQEYPHNTSNMTFNNLNNTSTNNTIYTYYDNYTEKIKIEITGEIDDQITSLLLDTGAGVTVVSKNIIKSNKITPESELYLKTANNTKLNILGTTMAEIKIGTIVLNHRIIIVDNLCTPSIIRLDTMKKINTILGLKNNLITFNYKRIETKLKMEQETQIQHVSHEILNEYQQYLLDNNKLQHFNNTYEEITGDLLSDHQVTLSLTASENA